MQRQHLLACLLLAYGVASLVHFTHNAEYLAEYPNLPRTWTRAGVYLAWLGMTAVGIVGWLLLSRGRAVAGLGVLAIYAALGIDSLGHYVVAPPGAHTAGMNSTIFIEVCAATLVLVEVARQVVGRLQGRHR